MRLTIHQPEHLPWAGLLNKISQVDCYVILDNVQFRKNYFQNRNKVCGCDELIWATLPLRKYNHSALINEILINKTDKLYQKWFRVIATCYSGFPFFSEIFPKLEECFDQKTEKLSDVNIAIITFMLEYLNIKTCLIKSSDLELPVSNDATDVNLNICKSLRATHYLSGPSGKDYLDTSRFVRGGIQVQFHEFKPKQYNHPRNHFEPNISFIDAMMLYGRHSRNLIVNDSINVTKV
jgi:hypothetical protein